MAEENQKDSVVGDSPVSLPEEDLFGRYPFAKRVGETLLSRRDNSSIVIGIYGPWGDGKSSALNFIQHSLKSHDDKAIVFKFNPWLLKDENALILGFFNVLAKHLGRSLSGRAQKIGKAVSKYGKIASAVSLGMDGGATGIAASISGGAISTAGKWLSSEKSLEDLKEKIESILSKEQKKIIVLMDDIDRLDKDEIQAIFKLVKLTADFDYISYVLAFDEELIASALGEKFGTSKGDLVAGRGFLEKIIQVPLHLPRVDQITLRQFCFDDLSQAIDSVQVDLSSEESQRFARDFIDGLEIRMTTPRMAIRYANAVNFALPLLIKEVNLTDLMLIEGVRIFYPSLYQLMRSRPEIFIEYESNSGRPHEDSKKEKQELIDEALKGNKSAEKTAIKKMLANLFPQLQQLSQNIIFGSHSEDDWAKNKRVCSRYYFDRYFTYSLSDKDFSDYTIDQLIEVAKKKGIDDVKDFLSGVVTEKNAENFITKLRRNEGQIETDVAEKLAKSLAKLGERFPDPEHFSRWSTAFRQAGYLIKNLIIQITDKSLRFDTAKDIATNAVPLSFAIECVSNLYTPPEKEKERDRIFSIKQEDELGEILVNRIKKEISDEKPLFLAFPPYSHLLNFAWLKWGDKDELRDHVKTTIQKKSKYAVELIKTYLPTTYGMDSGIGKKGDFDRGNYNSLIEIVDPEIVLKALKKDYGDELNNPQYREDDEEWDLDKRSAHQFAFVHKKATEEAKVKRDKEKKKQEIVKADEPKEKETE